MRPDPRDSEFAAGELTIRPWRDGDAEALYQAASLSIPTVGRWLPWCHTGYTQADSVAWVEHCAHAWNADIHYAFGIFAGDEARVLGGVGLNKFDAAHRCANLGYWVRGDAQGRGIATRAADRIAAFGFGLGLTRIEILAAVDNLASRRVAEKLGARFEGVEPARIEFGDVKLDAAVYALSSPEQKRS